MPWIWDGYVSRGSVTLFAAPPKLGKTTATCGLMSSVMRGLPFLDRSTEQTGCLLLTEERASTLATKDDRWKLSGAGLHVLMRHEAGDSSWPAVMAHATSYAIDNGCGLLVVDTWAAWANLGGESENAAGAVLEQLKPIMAAAAEGIGLLVITHTRKGGGQNGEGVRGSNALTGAADIIVELQRPNSVDDETIRVLRSMSRYDDTPAELVIALGDDGYEVRGDLATAKADGERGRVLAVVERVGTVTKDEAAAEAEMKPAQAAKYLSELFTSGLVGRTGKGVKGSPFVFIRHGLDPLGDESNSLWDEAA